MKVTNENKSETIKLVYEIPTNKDTKVFGPPTWQALHEIVENIPCNECKNESIDFMRFFHDLKNYELNKKIEYKKNFIYWINKISSLKNKPLILK